MPGALTRKKCNNYSQFTGYPNNRFTNFCDCVGIANDQWKIDTIALGCYGSLAFSTATQLAVSGLIDKEPPILSGQYNTNGVKYNYQKTGNFCPSVRSTGLSGNWINNPANNIKSSFDESVWFQFTGFAFDRMVASGVSMELYKKYAFHGSNTYFNTRLPHEFDNAKFKNAIDMNNALEIIYYQTEENRSHNSLSYSEETMAALQINGYGALSAKMASLLDSKIDDGRPGTGKVLAMKSGDAHRMETTEAQHIAGCYDQTADKVDKAIYHTTTNLKYGCNIIKIMEKVK